MNFFWLSPVFKMLNVIMLSVIMLIVVAPVIDLTQTLSAYIMISMRKV